MNSETSTPPPSVTQPDVDQTRRLDVLDGWRGLSMLGVLSCHMLPVGPKAWGLNTLVGVFGLSTLFALSGFLITANLLRNSDVRSFFIRRVTRVLPLAYLYIGVVLLLEGKDLAHYAGYFFFSINYQTQFITEWTSALWSLCVEMHFYLFIGLLVAACGRRGLWIMPVLALVITAGRIWFGVPVSLQTHFRVDEVFAGAAAALIHASPARAAFRRIVATPHPLIWTLFLASCCYDITWWTAYLRPYAATGMVACTLWRGGAPSRLLVSKSLKYVADISYGLYVLHPLMRLGWLGTGGKWELYLLKRPVGFILTFALAHISAFYYEQPWMAWGKKWSKRARITAAPAAG